jgi:predicted dehydrogenase
MNMKPRTTRLSRREFLRGAAAALAAPTIISGCAVSRPPTGAVQAKERPAPSERIVMGCIGVGGMGKGNMGAFMGRPEVQMVAVCDVDRSMREEAQKTVEDHYAKQSEQGTFKGCTAYNDFRELLDRDDIDAVMIGTPDHWHALISVAAAKAGKDIYCEKPLTLTIREAREMVNAVRRYGRVFQTGSQQRSSGGFRLACELIRNGRIGKLLTAHVNVGGPSGDCYLPAEPVPDGLDWDMWLGPAPWRPFNKAIHPFSWRSFRDYSGGGMTDWGAHHFDICQWAMDMDNSGPVEIIPPDGKEVKLLTFKYANGVLVYHGGYTGKGSGIMFTGTEGKVDVSREHLITDPEKLLKEPIHPGEVHLYQSKGHHADFLECVRTRQRPICDVEIGCRSVTVCHLGNLAYWLKRPLKWNPVKEEFIGDDEANRWLDRPKRAPWCL